MFTRKINTDKNKVTEEQKKEDIKNLRDRIDFGEDSRLDFFGHLRGYRYYDVTIRGYDKTCLAINDLKDIYGTGFGGFERYGEDGEFRELKESEVYRELEKIPMDIEEMEGLISLNKEFPIKHLFYSKKNGFTYFYEYLEDNEEDLDNNIFGIVCVNEDGSEVYKALYDSKGNLDEWKEIK